MGRIRDGHVSRRARGQADRAAVVVPTFPTAAGRRIERRHGVRLFVRIRRTGLAFNTGAMKVYDAHRRIRTLPLLQILHACRQQVLRRV